MNIIVSVDNNWGIGFKNDLLYDLKKDIDFFQQKTANKIVVMGSNTLVSLKKNAPLKNRINVCLTKDTSFSKKGIVTVNSLQELFEILSFYDSQNIFVIGGEQVYKQLLPYCNKAYITKIKAEKQADRFFENLDLNENWVLEKTSNPCFEDNTVFYFCEYVNKNPQKFNYGYEKPDLF